VMAASRKQVARLLGVDVVQQIVYENEARFTTITTKDLLYALVICGVCGQVLTFRNGSLRAVTPDNAATEFAFGDECIQVA